MHLVSLKHTGHRVYVSFFASVSVCQSNIIQKASGGGGGPGVVSGAFGGGGLGFL